jgi:aerobic-type carbon monoxide dehydrogenase small subunit (CoxS/CutS family)
MSNVYDFSLTVVFLLFLIAGLTTATTEPCPFGSYSLEQPGENCSPCPEHSTQCHGASITTAPGFWRESNESSLLQQCMLSTACPSTNKTGSAACARGYTAYQCSSCQSGHFLDINSLICSRCSGRDVAYAMIVTALSLAAVVYLCTQHEVVRASFQVKKQVIPYQSSQPSSPIYRQNQRGIDQNQVLAKKHNPCYLLGSDFLEPSEFRYGYLQIVV